MRRKDDVSILRYARSFERLQLRTSGFKAHDQILQVCFKWESKTILKQLLSHQNKQKYLKRLETTLYRREIKIVNF